jgi:hypothetical protein
MSFGLNVRNGLIAVTVMLSAHNTCTAPDGLIGRRMERVKGIEPSYSAWEAAALPLSYTR